MSQHTEICVPLSADLEFLITCLSPFSIDRASGGHGRDYHATATRMHTHMLTFLRLYLIVPCRVIVIDRVAATLLSSSSNAVAMRHFLFFFLIKFQLQNPFRTVERLLSMATQSVHASTSPLQLANHQMVASISGNRTQKKQIKMWCICVHIQQTDVHREFRRRMFSMKTKINAFCVNLRLASMNRMLFRAVFQSNVDRPRRVVWRSIKIIMCEVSLVSNHFYGNVINCDESTWTCAWLMPTTMPLPIAVRPRSHGAADPLSENDRGAQCTVQSAEFNAMPYFAKQVRFCV